MARVKAVMDKYVEKFISRKFLAWGVATYLVSTGLIWLLGGGMVTINNL